MLCGVVFDHIPNNCTQGERASTLKGRRGTARGRDGWWYKNEEQQRQSRAMTERGESSRDEEEEEEEEG
jgi:hypothetical protein